MTSLVDPLLWQSQLPYQEPVTMGWWRRFWDWWTPYRVFNIVLPIMAVLFLWWVLKHRYEQRLERQDRYVPAPFRSTREAPLWSLAWEPSREEDQEDDMGMAF